MHKFPYRWTLKDAVFTKDKGKVFSCFACGGGSTMGYKLAGFDVIGCNEIDPKMNTMYVNNHHPRINYLCDIRDLVKQAKRKELPEEMYQLDVLDGSPPCTSFSMAGNREKDWGKEKKFREGQTEQVLDTLFFDFIDLAYELQPKVVIAENVKGLIVGKALIYTQRIHQEFDNAGYYVQHFLLNGSKMGVPQKRERVFFLAIRKDLAQPFLTNDNLFTQTPQIDMDFDEEPIKFGEFAGHDGRVMTEGSKMRGVWEKHKKGDRLFSDTTIREYGKKRYFNLLYCYLDECLPTLVPMGHDSLYYEDKPMHLSVNDYVLASTFPTDYQTDNPRDLGFALGMSVPPVMMAQVASRVYDQWLSKLP